MEFEGQYLTYSEYKGLGGQLPEMPFNLLEYNARKEIDKYTFNRLVNETEQPQEVKLCLYKLVNLLNSYESLETQDKAIRSENTDGYSVTYSSTEKSLIEAKNNEIYSTIKTYLSNTMINGVFVLYIGV